MFVLSYMISIVLNLVFWDPGPSPEPRPIVPTPILGSSDRRRWRGADDELPHGVGRAARRGRGRTGFCAVGRWAVWCGRWVGEVARWGSRSMQNGRG